MYSTYRVCSNSRSALSQASRQSPDDERGAGLLPEEAGAWSVHSSEQDLPQQLQWCGGAKCQKVAALSHSILAVADIWRLLRCVGESCFLSTKVSARFKRLRLLGVRPKAEENRKSCQKMCCRHHCSPMAKGSPPMPKWIITRVFCCHQKIPTESQESVAVTRRPARPRSSTGSLQDSLYTEGPTSPGSVAAIHAASKPAGIRHLGCIAGKGQRLGSHKNKLAEADHLAAVG
jgi:hypothetical protein